MLVEWEGRSRNPSLFKFVGCFHHLYRSGNLGWRGTFRSDETVFTSVVKAAYTGLVLSNGYAKFPAITVQSATQEIAGLQVRVNVFFAAFGSKLDKRGSGRFQIGISNCARNSY